MTPNQRIRVAEVPVYTALVQTRETRDGPLAGLQTRPNDMARTGAGKDCGLTMAYLPLRTLLGQA